MKSVFFRIFFSYWIAQALFVVFAILITLAMRPPGEIANIEAMESGILDGALQARANGGENSVHRYLRNLRETQHVWASVFDADGKDILGGKPPEWIESARLGKTRTADSIWGRLGPRQFLRRTLTGSDGRTYTLVIEIPPEKHEIFGPHAWPGTSILIGVVTSGIICFLLARYLMAPVARLRAATQKLASGDLSARAGFANGRRRDEMSQLLRDFDLMAERLESLVTSQNRLLSDISHELRSPLARLNVALELARQRSGPEAESSLDRMNLEADRLNTLIGRLLTVARLDNASDSLTPNPVNLGELIADVAQDAAFEAQHRRCGVECLVQQECQVAGDSGLLRSAIENVVRNAVRYTKEGTTVQITLERSAAVAEPVALIRVEDRGPGVPEASLNKLFEPFYRLDDARGRGTGGVGLGLAITERAIRFHRGSVRAVNRAEGGLLVEIKLPLVADEEAIVLQLENRQLASR